MPRYIALTTTNPQGGWEFLGAADTREELVALEPSPLAPSGSPEIYAETRHRNFRIVSKTRAREYLGRRGAELAARGIDPHGDYAF